MSVICGSWNRRGIQNSPRLPLATGLYNDELCEAASVTISLRVMCT